MDPPTPMYSCVAGAGLDTGTEFLDIITADEAASLVSTLSVHYVDLLCNSVFGCI